MTTNLDKPGTCCMQCKVSIWSLSQCFHCKDSILNDGFPF